MPPIRPRLFVRAALAAALVAAPAAAQPAAAPPMLEQVRGLGLGFLARVREAFPATDGPALDSDAVLARLEALRPGFRARAERLGTPRTP